MGSQGMIYVPKKLRSPVQQYLDELRRAEEEAVRQACRPGKKSMRDFYFPSKKGTARDLVFLGGAGFLAIALLFLVTYYVYTSLFQGLLDSGLLGSEADSVLQAGVDIYNRIDTLSVAVFIATFLTFIVTSYFVGGHPLLMPIYFIVGLAAVIISMMVSNLWESLTSGTTFTTALANLPFTNWLMLNLPVVIGAFYLVGIVITFARAQGDTFE